MTYAAIVARIHTREFPNADRLLLGTVVGNQVVVGKDTQDGELGVFFPCDGQLSEEFCQVHDLIAYTDEQGNKKGGFFARNRRVRAQRFRGEKSDGFWVPLSYFDYTGIKLEVLVEGYQFTELNGHPICNRYETQATRTAKQGQQAKAKKKNIMFAEHIETEQLAYHIGEIPTGSHIYISEKCHGTSHRVGNVLDEKPLTTWKRYLNRILYRDIFAAKKAWREIHGTRRVVLGETLVDSYYNEAFRGKATEALRGQLRKGEVVYLEIVGWVNQPTPIMPIQDVTKLKDKATEKKYGKAMTYAYGCQLGEQRIYVYRITQVNEDGYTVELSWNQMAARCRELGVPTVPQLDSLVYDGNAIALEALVSDLAEGASTLDPSHIREGVVLRVEQPDGLTNWYKYKSFTFKVLEGIAKDDETIIDIEEAS